MTPSLLRAHVVAERVAWIRRMLAGLQALPLEPYDTFASIPGIRLLLSRISAGPWKHCSTSDGTFWQRLLVRR